MNRRQANRAAKQWVIDNLFYLEDVLGEHLQEDVELGRKTIEDERLVKDCFIKLRRRIEKWMAV